MKKLVIGGSVAVVVLGLHRFGPAIHDKAMEKCVEMFRRAAGGSASGNTTRYAAGERGEGPLPRATQADCCTGVNE